MNYGNSLQPEVFPVSLVDHFANNHFLADLHNRGIIQDSTFS